MCKDKILCPTRTSLQQVTDTEIHEKTTSSSNKNETYNYNTELAGSRWNVWKACKELLDNSFLNERYKILPVYNYTLPT